MRPPPGVRAPPFEISDDEGEGAPPPLRTRAPPVKAVEDEDAIPPLIYVGREPAPLLAAARTHAPAKAARLRHREDTSGAEVVDLTEAPASASAAAAAASAASAAPTEASAAPTAAAKKRRT